nr:MAG TPA: hypothetical protein [Caudoviricetes sp.]
MYLTSIKVAVAVISAFIILIIISNILSLLL